jgi:hypothetical protein
VLVSSGLSEKLFFVGCVAGGWAGGDAASQDLIVTTQKMMNTSLYTSMIASQLAVNYMAFDGLLLFTGAAAALEPTPDMIGYGAAKAAVHHLSQSIAKAYYPRFDTLTICPRTLDTPANRAVRSIDRSFMLLCPNMDTCACFWLAFIRLIIILMGGCVLCYVVAGNADSGPFNVDTVRRYWKGSSSLCFATAVYKEISFALSFGHERPKWLCSIL